MAEALVATAAGLCVAIPSLIAYRYLRGRVEGIVVEMEKNALRLVDAVEAAVAALIKTITPNQCRNFFTEAGYAAT